MIFTSFVPYQPIPSSRLSRTIMALDDWALVKITGKDSEKYLQNQLTADITNFNKEQHLLTAHCDQHGKILSNLYLFYRDESFFFILRRRTRDIQCTEFKKYALFSRVTITYDDSLILLGIAGVQSRTMLKKFFNTLPNEQKTLINDGKTSLLWFKYPIERFLLVTNKTTAQYIIRTLQGKEKFNNSQQWLALDIEAGIPIIDPPNIKHFIPQAINLHILGGISFKKGCYIGQEIIARAKFRGINKRRLWNVTGTTNRIPNPGENLELKTSKGWYRIGTILSSIKFEDGLLLVQAVMNNDLNINDKFRIQDDTNILNIKPLPYSL